MAAGSSIVDRAAARLAALWTATTGKDRFTLARLLLATSAATWAAHLAFAVHTGQVRNAVAVGPFVLLGAARLAWLEWPAVDQVQAADRDGRPVDARTGTFQAACRRLQPALAFVTVAMAAAWAIVPSPAVGLHVVGRACTLFG